MSTSLRSYLDVVGPCVPQSLVGESAMCQLEALASTLPASPIAGFERELASNLAIVDMAMCFSPGDTCADELLAAIRDNRLVGSAWRAVERALARAQTKSATGDQPLGVANAWLEFDVGDGRTDPSLFLTPDSPSSVSDYTQHYWPALSGAHPSAAVRAMLGVVDDHDGRLVHLARMLARDDDAVRLCLSNLGPPEMVRLLEDLGQTAVGFECAADLEFARQPSRMIFAVDIDEAGARDRYGIEFQPPGPATDPTRWWEQALEALVSDGLCTDGERNDLLSWPGLTRRDDTDAWPPSVEPVDWGSVRAEPAFDRRLHHLKLGFDGSRVIAKAYFGFVLTWQHVS